MHLVRPSDLHGMIGLEVHAIQVIQYRLWGHPALEMPWEVAFIGWRLQAHESWFRHCLSLWAWHYYMIYGLESCPTCSECSILRTTFKEWLIWAPKGLTIKVFHMYTRVGICICLYLSHFQLCMHTWGGLLLRRSPTASNSLVNIWRCPSLWNEI